MSIHSLWNCYLLLSGWNMVAALQHFNTGSYWPGCPAQAAVAQILQGLQCPSIRPALALQPPERFIKKSKARLLHRWVPSISGMSPQEGGLSSIFFDIIAVLLKGPWKGTDQCCRIQLLQALNLLHHVQTCSRELICAERVEHGSGRSESGGAHRASDCHASNGWDRKKTWAASQVAWDRLIPLSFQT